MDVKFSIDVFDLARLDFVFDPEANGVVRKVFTHLPDRPLAPHVSLFAEEDKLDLHFTAGHGRPNEFRRKLAKVAPARLQAVVERYRAAGVKRCVAALQPADLAEMERAGWTAHGANFEALRQWFASAHRRSRVYRVDGAVVTQVAEHVARNWTRPTVLASLPPAPRRLLALRGGGGSIEARPLIHFPDGYGVEAPDGSITLAHPPGWYTHPFAIMPPEVDREILPLDRMAPIAKKLLGYLSKFRRRTEENTEALEAIPAIAWTIFTYYSPDLLVLAFGVADDAATERVRGTAA